MISHLKSAKHRETPGSNLVVLLFAAMVMDSVNLPGTGLPANSIAMGFVAAYAILFRRGNGLALPRWAPALVLAIPGWLLIASVTNGAVDFRRVLSVALYAAVILVVALSRVNSVQIARGLGIAVVVGVVLGLVGPWAGGYGDRLTGPFGDPNSAGFNLAVFTALAFPSFSATWRRNWLVAIAVLGIVLTQSRTTMVTTLIMILWIVLFRYRAPILAFLLLLVPIVWISTSSWLDSAFSDRAGSDALRGRITAAELQDVALSPWAGNGAGTARIFVGGHEFFYHNSYLAIRAEAGWVGLLLVLSVLALVILALVRLPRRLRNPYYEVAIIGVAICAINVGEILLTLTAAIAVGTALRYVVVSRHSLKLEAGSTPLARPQITESRSRRRMGR